MTSRSTYHFIYFYQRCIHFGTSASLRKLCGGKDYSCSFRRLAYAPNLMHELIRIGVIMIFAMESLSAHGGHDKKDSLKSEAVSKQTERLHQPEMTGQHQNEEMQDHHDAVMGRAELNDFPSLHPLVVHFPIVLLLLAALSQFVGLFVFKEQLSWITLVLVFLGFIGALLASRYIHPYTVELAPGPAWLLEQHEQYANWTLYAGIIALILKALSHFLLRRKLWAEILVLIALGFSTFFVTTASHYGAQLTHIEGVGPQGHYLEMHSAGGEHEH